jgi:hypothetical protein
MCFRRSFALIASWQPLLTCGNAEFLADMTDASWQSEQMNPATTTGRPPRSAPTLVIIYTTT